MSVQTKPTRPSRRYRPPEYVEERLIWRAPDVAILARRTLALRLILGLGFIALTARLWYMQVYSRERYEALAQQNRVRRVPMPMPRGIIFDRNGKVLATSRCIYNVAIVPAALPDGQRERVFKHLAALLKKPPQDIIDTFDTGARRAFEPVTVAENVDMNTLIAVEESRPHLPGVLVITNIARKYVNGQFAAHVLGHIGEVTRRELERRHRLDLRLGDMVGKMGVEKEFDVHLVGERGSELVEVNAGGRPVRSLGRKAAKPAPNVFLTLDAKLQRAAEEGLKANGQPGAVAVVDVRNGDVLALASRPDFNPDKFGNHIPRDLWRALNQRADRPLYNRAIAGLNAPGSTFKMITAIAGLESGAITPNSTFVCPGGLRLGRYYKRCWRAHGACNLYRAIAGSCDVYFYHVSRRAGADAIARVANRFGLGVKTGVDLAGERAGLIPTPAWKKERYEQEWFTGDTLNTAIGQGYVQATPLQMACMTAAIANGGTYYRPHLLKKVVESDGQTTTIYPPQGRSVRTDAKILEIVRVGMRQVVIGGSGTARSMNIPQVTVAGKTGSAEEGRGEKSHAWFLCFAPYETPRVAVCVMLENAGHGGTEAAPIARKILEAAFGKKGQ
jgi:penicillin-binding protein 2